MKVSVYDTYVRRSDGRVMHFDILVRDSLKDQAVIHGYGREYLQSKGEAAASLGTRECRFCHIENATPTIENAIATRGYYILEMENC